MTRQGTTASIASTAIAALILVVVVPTMLVNRAVLWWSLLILLGVAAAIGAVVGGVRLLRWGRRGQLVLAGGILAVAMAVFAVLSYEGLQYGGAPSATTVTVPVISTAKLVDDDHWEVTHTMTLPEGTRAPRELGNGFGNEWALVEVVDKHPIYVQTVEVPVDLSKFDTSTSTIDAPGAPDPESRCVLRRGGRLHHHPAHAPGRGLRHHPHLGGRRDHRGPQGVRDRGRVRALRRHDRRRDGRHLGARPALEQGLHARLVRLVEPRHGRPARRPALPGPAGPGRDRPDGPRKPPKPKTCVRVASG